MFFICLLSVFYLFLIYVLEERRRLLRKTLTKVVKEQLKKRPYKDLNNLKEGKEEIESDREVIIDNKGRIKKIVKKRFKT